MSPRDWYTDLEKRVLRNTQQNDTKVWTFIRTTILPLIEQDFQRRKKSGEPPRDMELRRILIKQSKYLSRIHNSI
jgi:hypothetical protein